MTAPSITADVRDAALAYLDASERAVASVATRHADAFGVAAFRALRLAPPLAELPPPAELRAGFQAACHYLEHATLAVIGHAGAWRTALVREDLPDLRRQGDLVAGLAALLPDGTAHQERARACTSAIGDMIVAWERYLDAETRRRELADEKCKGRDAEHVEALVDGVRRARAAVLCMTGLEVGEHAGAFVRLLELLRDGDARSRSSLERITGPVPRP